MRHRGTLGRTCLSLVVAGLGACTSWHTQPLAPDQVVTQQPQVVRVERTDGRRVVLRTPQLAADSLAGIADGRRVAVALADIRSLAVPRTDPLRTTALLLLGGIVAGAAIIVIAVVPGYNS